MGDSRYVVEPNVKEGKGGLRDLHALFWIGKYAYRRRAARASWSRSACSPPRNCARFDRAERFLWAVRCHLHLVAGRAEERLTFDYQREIAASDALCRPAGKIGGRALHAILFPAREDGRRPHRRVPRPSRRAVRAARAAASRLPTIRRRPRELDGFVLDRGRLAIPDDDFFARRSGAADRAVRARRRATGSRSIRRRCAPRRATPS